MKFLTVFFSATVIALFVLLFSASIARAQAPVNPGTISQANQQGSCGAIGQSCCGGVSLPAPRLHIDIPLVSIVLNPLLDVTINPILSILDPLVDKLAKDMQSLRGRQCSAGVPSDPNNPAGCTCVPAESFNIAKLCLAITKPAEQRSCIDCSRHGVWTALGCIDYNIQTFVRETLLGFGVGLAGAISLLCVIYSAILIQTSRGDPERLKKARERLTSCIMGLLLIIFSVFILKLIGVDILRIPGLL